jgi:CRISPR-associated protein Csh2
MGSGARFYLQEKKLNQREDREMSETKAVVQKMAEETKTLSHRHETLFLWDVRKSNPNGDPNGNEPRIDRYTKKCDVTDVCIKRSVRNYIAAVSERGNEKLLVTRLGTDLSETVTLTKRIETYLLGDQERKNITCGLIKKVLNGRGDEAKDLLKVFLSDPSPDSLGKLLSAKKEDFAKALKGKADEPKAIATVIQQEIIAALRAHLCKLATDLRMFGSVLALQDEMKPLGGPLTGPIQIEMATSVHRVVQANKQITSVMGSKEEKEAGIIGDSYCIEYGLFATSAIANEHAAVHTGLTNQDHELFLKSLWRGTRDRHTRSKNAVPRLLIDIEYSKPFHCGDLISTVELEPAERDGKKLEQEQFRDVKDFTVRLQSLYAKLNKHKEIIAKIQFANNDLLPFDSFKQGLGNDWDEKIKEIPSIDYDKNDDCPQV